MKGIESPDESVRLINNLMALNELFKKFIRAIKHERVFEATSGRKYFTILDIKKGIINWDCERNCY